MQKHWLLPVLGVPLVVLLAAGGFLYVNEAKTELVEEEVKSMEREPSSFYEMRAMLSREMTSDDFLLEAFYQMDWEERREIHQEYFAEVSPFVELEADPSLFLAHFERPQAPDYSADLSLEDVQQFQEWMEVWEGEWLTDWANALTPDSDEMIYSCSALFANLDDELDYLEGEWQVPAYSISNEDGHELEVNSFRYSEGDDELFLSTECTEEFPYWDSIRSNTSRYVLRFEEQQLRDIFIYDPEVTLFDQTLIEWFHFDYDEKGEREWVRHLRMGNASDQLSMPHMEYEYEQGFELEIY